MGSGTGTPVTTPSSLSVTLEIATLAEVLAFLGLNAEGGLYEINSANDVMVFTSSEGGPMSIDIPDGTYSGDSLATALTTAMNADNTLTGTGTITFVVSFSPTAYKFTIDAGAGNTVAYTHTGSDAGLTLGFTANASADQTITSDTAVPGDPSDLVETIHNGVEQDMVSGVRDSFNQTIYRHQRVSGNGTRYLRLRNWPVTELSSVAISKRPVIQIRNTSPDATRALVSVDVNDQVLRLSVIGGTNAGVSSPIDLTASGSDTIAELITTANALGKGWDLVIDDDNFEDMLSIELLEVKGLNVANIEDTGTPSYEDLLAPDPLIQIEVNETTGNMYRSSGWPSGNQNVMVSYTGGFSTIPGDLKAAVLRLVKLIYDKVQESGDGMKSISLGGGVSLNYLDEIPAGIQRTLDKYRDILL